MRDFVENDYSSILEIYARSKLDELRFEENRFDLLPLESDSKRLGELKESEIFVFEDQGVKAYGALFGSEIRALFVHPDSRGKGLGKKLLEHLLSKITGKANLYIAKSNSSAKKLYENHGFEITSEFQTNYNGTPVVANKLVRSSFLTK
jgi:putative acetyltransferase